MQPDDFAEKFDVSRETIERLTIYEALLKERGQTLSLIGRATLDDIWERHFADSAQIFNLVKMHSHSPLPVGEDGSLGPLGLRNPGEGPLTTLPSAPHHFANADGISSVASPTGRGSGRSHLLDMGTGAGFPGMILAIMGIKDIHLSDNNQKKIEFLYVVAEAIGTEITIHNCKAEAVPDLGFETITARALAPLDELLKLSARFFGPKTQAIFLKGRAYESEIETANRSWNFAYSAQPSLTNADSAILTITQLERRKAA